MSERTSSTEQLRKLRGERGFTLIELLIGATMTLAIVMAALPIIDGAAKTQGRVQTAGISIGTARTFSELVTEDLRSAYTVVPPVSPNTDANSITVKAFVHNTSCGSRTLASETAPMIQCRVSYVCSGGACTRQERNPDGTGSGTPVTMVVGLSSNNIFSPSYSGDSVVRYVGIELVLPNTSNVGDDAITLDDGVALRNQQ